MYVWYVLVPLFTEVLYVDDIKAYVSIYNSSIKLQIHIVLQVLHAFVEGAAT